jgi:hypothetical protein
MTVTVATWPLVLLLGAGSLTSAADATKASSAFCALPEMLDTWSFSDGCNGAPQFLSAFCPDHVSVVGGALNLLLDGKPCAQPTHPQCGSDSHPYGGASITGLVKWDVTLCSSLLYW